MTQHQAIGPIRGVNLKPLIENQKHTKYNARVTFSQQQERGGPFQEKTNCSWGNNLLLRKTVLASRNRHKNEIILVSVANHWK
jgi:hypothetical protein